MHAALRNDRPLAPGAIEEYRKFVFLALVAGHQITPSDQVDQVWHLHLHLQLLAVRLLQYRPPMRPLAAARCSQPGHLGELKAHPPPERVSQSAGDGRHERAVHRCAGPMGSSTVAGAAMDHRSTVARQGRPSILLCRTQGDELDLFAAQLDLELIAGR